MAWFSSEVEVTLPESFDLDTTLRVFARNLQVSHTTGLSRSSSMGTHSRHLTDCEFME